MTDQDREQPLVSHLVELRSRLIRMIVGVLAVFVVLVPFANQVYAVLATPLIAQLPASSSMIAIDVITPFLTPVKLCLILALFIAMPWVLYQLWAFVAPGLYRSEQRLALPIVASSTILFYAGIAFAYYVIMPLCFAFLNAVAPEGVAMMTDIHRYLDFALTLFFAFGIAFEVPIATFILVMMGVTTPDALVAKRPYVILASFVIGMLLTPPDVISQTLLALPMWLLFELGVLFSRIMLRRRAGARRPAS